MYMSLSCPPPGSSFKHPTNRTPTNQWGKRLYGETIYADLSGIGARADLILSRRRKSRKKKYKFFNRGCVTVYNNKSLTSRGELPPEDRKRAKRRRRKRKILALKRKQEKREQLEAMGELHLSAFIGAERGVAGVDRPPVVGECSLEVQNWVITCEIEAPMHPAAAQFTRFSINLHHIAIALRHKGMQYNPERFHAGITRFRDPNGAVLVFSGCAVVCTGAKTQARAELLVATTISNIGSISEYRGLRMKPDTWLVRNVVGSATMPFNINLERLYNANQSYCGYDPNIFPGLTFRLINPWARAILIFNSGKCVITGAQSDTNLPKALKLCIPYIWAAREGISVEQAAFDAPKKTSEELVRDQLLQDADITSRDSRALVDSEVRSCVFQDEILFEDPYHQQPETVAAYMDYAIGQLD